MIESFEYFLYGSIIFLSFVLLVGKRVVFHLKQKRLIKEQKHLQYKYKNESIILQYQEVVQYFEKNGLIFSKLRFVKTNGNFSEIQVDSEDYRYFFLFEDKQLIEVKKVLKIDLENN